MFLLHSHSDDGGEAKLLKSDHSWRTCRGKSHASRNEAVRRHVNWPPVGELYLQEDAPLARRQEE